MKSFWILLLWSLFGGIAFAAPPEGYPQSITIGLVGVPDDRTVSANWQEEDTISGLGWYRVTDGIVGFSGVQVEAFIGENAYGGGGVDAYRLLVTQFTAGVGNQLLDGLGTVNISNGTPSFMAFFAGSESNYSSQTFVHAPLPEPSFFLASSSLWPLLLRRGLPSSSGLAV